MVTRHVYIRWYDQKTNKCIKSKIKIDKLILLIFKPIIIFNDHNNLLQNDSSSISHPLALNKYFHTEIDTHRLQKFVFIFQVQEYAYKQYLYQGWHNIIHRKNSNYYFFLIHCIIQENWLAFRYLSSVDTFMIFLIVFMVWFNTA